MTRRKLMEIVPRTPSAKARAEPVMTTRLTWLFAVAGGAAVGNLYWAQPLLDFIAHGLHSPVTTAGWLVTATQIGRARADHRRRADPHAPGGRPRR
jgi:hypothetical protein